jgi:chromosome segregation ATPase
MTTESIDYPEQMRRDREEIARLRAEVAQVREILGERENTITRLTAQRDRLLAALKRLADLFDLTLVNAPSEFSLDPLREARAAIAAMESSP